MGYSESSKASRIYFPGFKKIDISRDVTFDEDSAYNKSIKKLAEVPKAPRIHDTTMNKETQEEDQEFEEPQRPVDPLGVESSQEETYLGTRDYPRCGKVWGSRRES